MKNEKVIDIKEFSLFILLKWRLAIIWIVIFAFLLNSFSCFQSYKNRKNAEFQLQQVQEEESQIQTSDYDQYTSEMNEMDIEETENAADNYLMLKDSYNKLKEYCDNSVKMQINTDAVAVTNLSYLINNTKDFESIYATLKNDIISDETSQSIIRALDWDTDYTYIPELLTISNSLSENDEKSHIISIKIIAPDKEASEKIGSLLNQQLEDKIGEYKNAFGDFKLTQLPTNSYVQADGELLLSQQTYKEKKNGIHSLMNSLFNSLDGNQQTYFKAIINDKEIITEIADKNDMGSQEIALPSIQYFNIKYILLGAVLGLLLFIVLYVILYVMDGKLQTATSIQDSFEIPVLGILNSPDTNKKSFGKKIDNGIKDIFKRNQKKNDIENILQMICSQIQIYVNKGEISHVCIMGNNENKYIKEISDYLTVELKKKKINVDSGMSLLTDANSLLKLSDCDGVILIEELMKSYRKDIVQEIDICKRYGVAVLGAVVIEG